MVILLMLLPLVLIAGVAAPETNLHKPDEIGMELSGCCSSLNQVTHYRLESKWQEQVQHLNKIQHLLPSMKWLIDTVHHVTRHKLAPDTTTLL